jgi:AraC-like DNA-binding protein
MFFQFNFYSSILLLPFVQGILFAVLLFVRAHKQEQKSDALLAWLLLLNAIKIAYWMLGFAGWYDAHNKYTTFMFYFPFENILWTGPLLYFYFLSITNAQFRFTKTHRKHFIIPALGLLLVVFKTVADFSLHYPFPYSELTQYGTKGPLADIDRNWIIYTFTNVFFLYYLFITLKAFKQYQQYIQQNFSDTAPISFSWLRNCIYCIAASVIIFLIFNIIAIFNNGTTYVFDWYAYLCLGIAVYYLSIGGYFTNQRQLNQLHFSSVAEKQEPVTDTESVKEKPVPVNDASLQNLLRYMQQHKPHLDEALNLQQLALQIKMPAQELSKLINNGTNQNFNDFINEYRVKELIEKLKAGAHHTQTFLGIAYDCGFNSKATFNRAFKKQTGQTPKDWVAQQNL